MKSRKAVELTERFNKRWLGYVTAASGTAVGLLAAAPPAMADIIYYPGGAPASSSICFGYLPCALLEMEGPQGGADVQFFSIFRQLDHATLVYQNASLGSRGVGMLVGPGPLRRGANIGPGEAFYKGLNMLRYAYCRGFLA